MRRTLVVLAAVMALCVLGARPWAARAQALQTPTGTTTGGLCSFSNYSLNGSFSRLGGTASFSLTASGGCLGLSSSATLNLSFTSVGPWSCVGGAAIGSGGFQPNNGLGQSVNASLVNSGGQYVIELHGLTFAAAGQINTVPMPCIDGQVQTTITGTGILTFAT
jgi:hypothetical protein